MTSPSGTESPLESPVALFVFRRPEYTAQVLDAILRARPRTLLVVADGPRPDRPDDVQMCAETRALIDRVGDGCEVITHFAPTNLGLRERMSSGLDWVFSQVDRAILLEDDCLPDPSFFRFCDELLVRYADDEQVMMISGNNFLLDQRPSTDSYYFSANSHIWGWATWRRAWQRYDLDMTSWPTARASHFLEQKFSDARTSRYWRNIFDGVHGGYIDTWDYQWTYACFAHDGLSVVPNQHLVSNLGFGPGATTTFDASDPHLKAVVAPLAFPLAHPETITADTEADRIEFANLFGQKVGWRRFKHLIPWKVRASARDFLRS